MKVLLLLGYGEGAMLQAAASRARALSKHAEVVVGLPSYSDASGFVPLPVHRLPIPRPGPMLYLRAIDPFAHAALRRWVKAERPDVVEIFSEHPIFLALTGRRRPYRIASWLHDAHLHPGERRWGRQWLRYRQHRRADYVIVMSGHVRDGAIALGCPPESIVVVPHGPMQTLVPPRPAPPEEKVVLFFGRLQPYKGLADLVPAFQATAKRFPDWRLRIVGPGSDPALTAARGDTRIQVESGFMPDAELSQALARAAFVVLPYREASQTGVIPTAHAFGKPVLATRVGGLPEAVQDGVTGLLVPPNDPQALRAGLERLMGDPRLVGAMGEAGRREAETTRSWLAGALRLAGVYESGAEWPVRARPWRRRA